MEIRAELARAREDFSRRDPVSASRRIESVLRSNPDSAEARIAKGLMFTGQRRPNEALISFKEALDYDPQNPEALNWAAVTCLNLGKGDEAEEFAGQLLRLQPNNDRAYFLLTNALCVQARLEEALRPLERALNLRPQEADYVVAKAQILGRLKWSSQAIEWYRAALALRPSPDLTLELADSLMVEGQVEESLVILEGFSAHFPSASPPYGLLAQAYTESQQFERAETAWNFAFSHSSDPTGLALFRAQSEVYAGRLDIAAGFLEELIAENPNSPSPYRILTGLKKITQDDSALVESMERLLTADLLIDPSDREELSYALGKAYNDLGDYGRAMEAFDEANRLAFESSSTASRFDPKAWREYIDLQIEFFTKERMGSLVQAGLESDQALFIVGMIRSGTTLSEQILSRHSLIKPGGEKTFWPDHRNELLTLKVRKFDISVASQLGKTFLEILTKDAGAARYVIEKNPSNVFMATALHCVYPNAKFIHVMRDALDNALSIWMTPLKTGLPFVYNRENIVFAFQEHARLLRHLEEVMPEDRFKSFRYEEITSNPVPTISKMIEFLGLEIESSCFHPEANARTVRTPSYYQVRQPIHTGSQEKWKRYEPWLGSFRDLLASG